MSSSKCAFNGYQRQSRESDRTRFIVAIVLLATEVFFFGDTLRLDVLVGDSGDGRLTMLLTEHWYHVLQGKQSLTDLGFFYPAQNTLGYSDIFLGFGIVHNLFRLFGLDMYLSYKLSLMAIHVFGTVSLYYFLRRQVRTDVVWSLLGIILFSLAPSYAEGCGHTQMIALSMLPPLLVFFGFAVMNRTDKTKRRLFGLLGVVQLLLILYTAWYTFFFFALYCAVFTVLLVIIVSFMNGGTNWKKIISQLSSYSLDLVVAVVIFVVGIIPFILLELPLLELSGGRDYTDVAFYLPEPIDIINVSTSNLIFGPFINELDLDERGLSGENNIGFSPLAIFLFVILSVRQFTTRKDNSIRNVLMRSLVLSVVLCILVALKLGSNGVSLWRLVYGIFPGAKSIRAVTRLYVFLCLPMAIAIAAIGSSLCTIQQNRILSVAIVFLILLSSIRVGGVPSGWERQAELSFIESVAVPPSACEAFYLRDPSDNRINVEPYVQLDAYQIANEFNVPTINGYSGLTPEGWWVPCCEGVRASDAGAAEWASLNGLQGLYAYDCADNIWVPIEEVVETDMDAFLPSE